MLVTSGLAVPFPLNEITFSSHLDYHTSPKMIEDNFHVPIAPMPSHFSRRPPSIISNAETDSTFLDDSSVSSVTRSTRSTRRNYHWILPKFNCYEMAAQMQSASRRARSASVPSLPAGYPRREQEPRVRRRRAVSVTTNVPVSHQTVNYELDEVRDVDKEEYRRRMHLRCEHKRRDAIASGIASLQKAITQVTGMNVNGMTKIGVIQEAAQTVMELKDKRTGLASERDKLLALTKALERGDNEAMERIEREWQERQLGGGIGMDVGGDEMIGGSEDISVFDEMTGASVANMLIGEGQQQQWIDFMNGAGLSKLAMQDDSLAETLTTRSTSASIEPSLISGESVKQEEEGDLNDTNAQTIKRQRGKERKSARKIGR